MTQLHEEVAELRRLNTKLAEHLVTKLIELRNQCDKATCPNIKTKEDYIPGSYLDRGYTSYYRECSLCHFHEHLRTVSDGSYG